MFARLARAWRAAGPRRRVVRCVADEYGEHECFDCGRPCERAWPTRPLPPTPVFLCEDCYDTTGWG